MPTFNFTVERFKIKSSELLFTEEECPNEDEVDIENVVLEVSGNSSYEPGYYHGLPEDCYESSCEVEIISVTDTKGNNWLDKITTAESEAIMDCLADRWN